MILVKEFGKEVRQIKKGEYQTMKLYSHQKFLELGGVLIGFNKRIWKKGYAETQKSN